MAFTEKVSGFFNKAKVETEILGVDSKRKAAINSATGEIRSLEQTLRFVYEKIGRQIYTNYRDNYTDSPVAQDISEADRLTKKISALSEEINQINKDFDLQIQAIRASVPQEYDYQNKENTTITCVQCGFINNGTDTFCANCGNKLEVVAPQQEKQHCANCGEEINKSDLFCANCGAKNEGDPTAQNQQNSEGEQFSSQKNEEKILL